jgi:hypothetical protein
MSDVGGVFFHFRALVFPGGCFEGVNGVVMRANNANASVWGKFNF